FYNDSKATVPEATAAAVSLLKTEQPHARMVLFWGGVSKGIDRKIATEQLSRQVDLMICFGQEREALATWSQEAGCTVLTAATLEEALRSYWDAHARAGDQVLFSPGGASFDLFTNFEARGTHFTTLVESLR